MGSDTAPAIGTTTWRDLTVPNAEEVRDFYQAVVGWESSPLDMGGYSDFVMIAPATGDGAAGICHARGENADLPPLWLVYWNVADLDASTTRCRELGGAVIAGPRAIGDDRFAVIRDPAGAVCALYQSAAPVS